MKKIKKPLKLGFVGGGLSSTIGQTHFTASRLDGLCEIKSGFFSRNKLINIKTASKWNINRERVYDSFSKFINEESAKLDAIVVLTPTPNHYSIIRSLIKKKIPIICEKPTVDSVYQAKLLKKLIKKNNSFLSVTYNYTGYPMIRELRQLVFSGRFGKIKQFHFEMPQGVFSNINSKPQKWRLHDKQIPTICLDLGVHLHNLANFITGKEPNKVIANFFNNSKYKKLTDNALMWLEYKDGMKGTFWMSKTATGNRNDLKLKIYGEKASAEWSHNNPEELYLSYNNGVRQIVDRGSKCLVANEKRYNRYRVGHPAGFIEAFANLYLDIVETIINNKKNNKYVFDLNHSLRGLELFESACRSNKSHKWQTVNYSNKENYL